MHGPCLTVLGGVLVWIHRTVPGLGVEEYGLPLRCLQFGELWLGGVRFGDQESGMKDKVWSQAQPRIARSIREDMKVPWLRAFVVWGYMCWVQGCHGMFQDWPSQLQPPL